MGSFMENTQSGQTPEGRGTFMPNRAMTLKLVPLGMADAPQGIKGAFSAVFDALSKFNQTRRIIFLKEERPFLLWYHS